jgi:hypothetical protein
MSRANITIVAGGQAKNGRARWSGITDLPIVIRGVPSIQIPPDLVVKFQPIDIVDITL